MPSVTENEARAAIVNAFETGWASATLVLHDNAPGEPPDGTASWVRVSVRFYDGEQISLGPTGSRLFRRYGILTIQVFVIVGTSTYTIDGLVRTAKNIFEGKTLSGVTFRNARQVTVGADEKWWQENVVAEFWFDEIK